MDATPESNAATSAAGTDPPRYRGHCSVPPSVWHSAVHAFRQARLARLEARLQRLRRTIACAHAIRDPLVELVPAEREPEHWSQLKDCPTLSVQFVEYHDGAGVDV
jgi:hypothetical protein